MHPVYANETAVRNEGHVTYISGKTFEELDLATVKFLMVVLGIDMEQINIGQSGSSGVCEPLYLFAGVGCNWIVYIHGRLSGGDGSEP